ncbi:MAG: hypothetical protein GVY24_03760 [Planctomycetes bacterium]|nr:hypothetical protein [Planctomycetota bacterium]
MDESWLLLVHAGATWFMTGLIWFVQVVHYAMFDRVGDAPAGSAGQGYVRYQHDHMRLTTWVVGPVMLVEAATAAALVVLRPVGVPGSLAWAGLLLVVALWASTAALQVPAHRRLTLGFDPAAHRRLLRTNWLRTAMWSARGILALWMIHFALTNSAAPIE